MAEVLRVTRSLSIPLGEIEFHFTTSGGPGGQHANRSSTRVEVRFDVARSASLGPRQRARLLQRFGPVVRATAGDSRSQSRNRDLALDRLSGRLGEALAVRRTRVATTPTAAARARRIEDKRRRGALKRQRGAGADD